MDKFDNLILVVHRFPYSLRDDLVTAVDILRSNGYESEIEEFTQMLITP